MIDDTGNGTPTLTSLALAAEIDDFIDGGVFGIPGSTLQIHQKVRIGPTSNQTGSGSTSSSISWGNLTGWSQTGSLRCTTHCPGGCGGASGCTSLFGFEGSGPLPPLKATSFATDPWVFAGDELTGRSFEIAQVTALFIPFTSSIQIGGRLITVPAPIPALPLAALGGLGAGLVYVGGRMLGRRSG